MGCHARHMLSQGRRISHIRLHGGEPVVARDCSRGRHRRLKQQVSLPTETVEPVNRLRIVPSTMRTSLDASTSR